MPAASSSGEGRDHQLNRALHRSLTCGADAVTLAILERELRAMVAIIERKDAAAGAEFIEFRVYRSPADREHILARWQHAREEPFGARTAPSIAQSTLGTPVEIEFEKVVDYADASGTPFIWVNDPEGLFPPSNWPAV
jgi:hypothetical protein